MGAVSIATQNARRAKETNSTARAARLRSYCSTSTVFRAALAASITTRACAKHVISAVWSVSTARHAAVAQRVHICGPIAAVRLSVLKDSTGRKASAENVLIPASSATI